MKKLTNEQAHRFMVRIEVAILRALDRAPDLAALAVDEVREHLSDVDVRDARDAVVAAAMRLPLSMSHGGGAREYKALQERIAELRALDGPDIPLADGWHWGSWTSEEGTGRTIPTEVQDGEAFLTLSDRIPEWISVTDPRWTWRLPVKPIEGGT